MNKVTLIGNSGADAKLEYTPSGMAVCKFSIAVSEKKGDEFHSIWFDIVLFKDMAERKQPLIKKGCRIFVDGKFSVNEWKDKNGIDRKNFSVIAYSVEICERPIKTTSNYGEGQNKTPSESKFNEGDIPF
jgi:single-strand DNA-binding protein